MANPTLNAPVATIIQDMMQQTAVLITGTYTAASPAANTIVVRANTLFGANNSQPCIANVVSMQLQMGTVNGFVLVEYVSSNTANVANQVIGAFGKSGSGVFAGCGNQISSGNTFGDIQVDCGGFAANETFSLILVLNKDNSLGCWANQYNGYPAT